MKDMVSKANNSQEKPIWINDTLWQEMTDYWDIEEGRAKSGTTSATWMSDCNSLGPYSHVTGQKSFGQVEQKMIVELGRPVTLSEVFIRTHTKKDGMCYC